MIEVFPFLYSFRYFIIFILSKYSSCDQKKTINVMKSKTEIFFLEVVIQLLEKEMATHSSILA